MLRARIRNGLRSAVVETAEVPLVRDIYRAVYALQTSRAARLLRRVDGVQGLFVRGSTPARISPGMSDIDLFVVLDDSRPVSVELQAIERIGRLVRRINFGAPLIREVHMFTPAEIALLGRQSAGLYASVLFDAEPVGTRPVLPDIDDDPNMAREAVLREVCFRSARLLQHLYEGGLVGHRLAARAHAKSLDALVQLEQAEVSMVELRRAYATGARVPADFHDVLALHRRIDATLPDAPEVVATDPWTPHPVIEGAIRPVREWFRPFENAPGVTGAVLSAEGARRADLRFYVLLDPTNEGASSTLERLGVALEERPFPSEGFSRYPWPIVLTPRQCARSVFQRWTPTEPITRLRHGVTIAGTAVTPRATTEEMTRELVLDWIGSANRIRELFAGNRSAKNLEGVSDTLLGVAPAIKTLATTGRFVTLPPHTESGSRELIRSLHDREMREEVLERLRSLARGPCATLVPPTTRAGSS